MMILFPNLFLGVSLLLKYHLQNQQLPVPSSIEQQNEWPLFFLIEKIRKSMFLICKYFQYVDRFEIGYHKGSSTNFFVAFI